MSKPLNPFPMGPYQCGQGQPMLVMAGPCVIESEELVMKIAEKLNSIRHTMDVPVIFKASFDKANRTSVHSFRGPGLEKGLAILEKVKETTGLPVMTDIHEVSQAAPAAEVCDVLQIPAFLCRQTDLLVAAAQTGVPVQVKKGQFLSSEDMPNVVHKILQAGNNRITLCERGNFFGYGRIVNDFGNLPRMHEIGVPVVYDAAHSVQMPGGLGNATGGARELIPYLSRAAVAVGIDGLFFETHPTPDAAMSDGPNMIPLDDFETLLKQLLRLRKVCDELAAEPIHVAKS